MRKVAAVSAVFGVLLLAGCSGGEAPIAGASASQSVAPVSSPSPTAAASASIVDVLEKTGCARPIDTAAKSPVVEAVSCKIGADGELAFLWQLPSAAAAKTWLDGGGIEIGPTDAVYVDGNVVMLATDAATSKTFAEIGTAYP